MIIKKTVLLLCCAIFLAFLFLSTATAGGIEWLFQVQDFREVRSGEYVIILKPLESGKEFPLNCAVLTVHAQYNSWRWFFVSDKNISKANHKKALSLLKETFVAQSLVRFGSMGEGFGFEGGQSSCEVSSRALSVIDVDGKRAVYSYFKWP